MDREHRISAGAIIVQGGRILLVKHGAARHGRSFLVGPGGRVENDESIIQAKVGGQEISFPIRLTFVLERREDRWLIVQLHGSLPAAGQREGESWPTRSS